MRIKKPVNLANISSDLGSPGAAIDWDLIDNNFSALSFDADGKAGILNIVTTDGAEGVELSGFLSVDGATTLNGTLDIDSNALLSGGGADGKLILSNLAGSQGVLFDTSTDGQLTLTDESSGDLNLRIDGRIFDGAGPLNLGTAAATGHSLTTGDVLVGGKLEVDGITYFDHHVYFYAGDFYIRDNLDLLFGNSGNSQIRHNKYQNPDTLTIGLSAESNSVIFIEKADFLTDFAHPQQTNPTIFIQSADATDIGQFGQFAWNRLALGGGDAGYGCINQTVLYSDFTDGGGLTGTLVLDEGIPDGAVVQQCILHTLTGFTGGANSTATITVGDGTDVDRYNTGTPDVYTSNASGVDLGSPSGTKFHDDAKNVTLTVTTDNDFSTISAGSFKIAVFYFTP